MYAQWKAKLKKKSETDLGNSIQRFAKMYKCSTRDLQYFHIYLFF